MDPTAHPTAPGSPRRARATYEDLENVGPDRVAELIDGELIVSPRPGGPHTNAASVLGALLVGPFRLGAGGPGGWHILDEPELHLGPADDPNVLVPDLAGWRTDRLPVIPEGAFFPLAPDWVCEVLSESTEALDRIRKLPVYRREGIRHVWLVSPKNRTLEVLRRTDAGWLLVGQHEGADKVRAEPFEAVELNLAHLWPAPVVAKAP